MFTLNDLVFVIVEVCRISPIRFLFPCILHRSMQAREAIWVAVYLDDMAFFVFSLEPILNCAGEYPLAYIVSLWDKSVK